MESRYSRSPRFSRTTYLLTYLPTLVSDDSCPGPTQNGPLCLCPVPSALHVTLRSCANPRLPLRHYPTSPRPRRPHRGLGCPSHYHPRGRCGHHLERHPSPFRRGRTSRGPAGKPGRGVPGQRGEGPGRGIRVLASERVGREVPRDEVAPLPPRRVPERIDPGGPYTGEGGARSGGVAGRGTGTPGPPPSEEAGSGARPPHVRRRKAQRARDLEARGHRDPSEARPLRAFAAAERPWGVSP